MFPFDQSLLPSLRTRKALLILDLQNDFVSADGALRVAEPEGYVQRTIDIANAFRQSGDGDVIWVRSEFEEHRPVEFGQILTSDLPMLSSMRGSSAWRNRMPGSGMSSGQGEADHEAFLSLAPGPQNPDEERPQPDPKPECVRPGTTGSALASEVRDSIASGSDSVLTKTHYSAFQSGQLLQLMRTRFATELYVCGALTNVSIHATALDAASHGFAMTIVDDCCGYRNAVRHTNAVRNLVQLTGCETITALDLIASLAPKPKPASASRGQTELPVRERQEPQPQQQRPAARASASKIGPARTGSSPRIYDGTRSSPKDKLVRDVTGDTRSGSSHPQEVTGDSKLRDASSAAVESHTHQPQEDEQPLQPVVGPRIEDTSRSQSNKPSSDPTPTQDTDPVESRTTYRASRPNDAAGESQAEDDSNKQIPSAPAKGANDRSKVDSSDNEKDARPASDLARWPQTKNTDPERRTPPPSKNISANMQSTASKDSVTIEADTTSGEETPAVKMRESGPTQSEPLCEGDTAVFYNVLPGPLKNDVFERLKDEIRWMRMSHQGGEVPRLVCVQGEVDEDGNMPVYRHPADESPPLVPFSPIVLKIKTEVEKVLGHPLNHALIQFYRNGNDYISEHSDKTLDIVKGSSIANVSLGAERTMVFRTKRSDKDPSLKAASDPPSDAGEKEDAPTRRRVVRARLPHNSLCRVGLKTNERWLHAIRQDKRQDREKVPEELAFSGGRISLTFRQIGTFLNSDSTMIWGQGAKSKSRDGARPVVNGQTEESIELLKGFGKENHSSNFDWEAVYGRGFDVLHMSNAPRFFSSSDPVVNLRIKLMLAGCGIAYAKGSMGPSVTSGESAGPENLPVKFVDNDAAKSSVQGDMAIMLYLDRIYQSRKGYGTTPAEMARLFTRFQQAMGLLDKWRAAGKNNNGKADGRDEATAADSSTPGQVLKPLMRELALLDAELGEGPADGGRSLFIAGGASASMADYALWPVLHDMQTSLGEPGALVGALRHAKLGMLADYYEGLGRSECVMGVLAGDVVYGAK